jgi:hypothetical protein
LDEIVERRLYEAAISVLWDRVANARDAPTARWVLEQFGGKASSREIVVLEDDRVVRTLAKILEDILSDREVKDTILDEISKIHAPEPLGGC